MKFKFVPLFLAAMALSACGASSSQPGTSTTSEPPAESWYYLDFMQGDKALRVDLFNIPAGLQFSYGNVSLSGKINNTNFDVNTKITVNKNLTAADEFNFIFVKDKKDGSKGSLELNMGIEGDKLQEFLALDGNKFNECDRAYVAISYGSEVKWTTGLNAKLDQDINDRKNLGA